MLAEIFSLDFWRDILSGAGRAIIASAGELLKIIIIYLVARAAVNQLIDRLLAPIVARGAGGPDGEHAARVRTLQGLARSAAGYLLFFIAAVMSLRAFRVDPLPVMTTAGVVGLAVGFGAQRLVRDVISGFFILLEDQFAVGEYVTAAGVTGTIEEIGMRVTRVRDDAGKLNIIANGDITNVCNHSRGAVSVSVDVSVAPDTDPEKVAAILDTAGAALAGEREDITAPLKCAGMVGMDAAKITLRFTGRCEAAAADAVQMAARRRFRDALLAAGIQPL